MFGLAVVRVCAMFAVLSARFGGVCMLGWFLGYWTLQKLQLASVVLIGLEAIKLCFGIVLLSGTSLLQMESRVTD